MTVFQLCSVIFATSSRRPGEHVALADLRALLANTGAEVDEQEWQDDEEEEEAGNNEDEDEGLYHPRRPESSPWFPQPKEPQDAGVALLKSGEFGRVRSQMERTPGRSANISRSLHALSMNVRPQLYREDLARVWTVYFPLSGNLTRVTHHRTLFQTATALLSQCMILTYTQDNSQGVGMH